MRVSIPPGPRGRHADQLHRDQGMTLQAGLGLRSANRPGQPNGLAGAECTKTRS